MKRDNFSQGTTRRPGTVSRSRLVSRSLRFHWRSHLGVVLGAAIASAALVGALIVGDSVRASLRDRALQRIGNIHAAWTGGDRLFRQALAGDITSRMAAHHPRARWHVLPALAVTGVAARQDGTARAMHVQVNGVTTNFFESMAGQIPLGDDEVLVNESLARQLHAQPNDEVVLRVRKPSALSLDAAIAPQGDASVALRMRIVGTVRADQLGDFSLRANQVPPENAFVRLDILADRLGSSGRANLLLACPAEESNLVDARELQAYASPFPLTLEDLQLTLRATNGVIELRTERVFIDDPIGRAATNAALMEWPRGRAAGETNRSLTAAERDALQQVARGEPIVTYLANQLRAGTNAAPYSMVTAAGPPYTPNGLRDDQVIVNDWLADDLQVKPGDALTLSYFAPDSSSMLVAHTNRFEVHSIVPLAGLHDDRTLMPDFPGIARAESTHDWDAGFPLVHTIRPKDDAYWKQHRGTPKGFITFAAGERMWRNRFGTLTSIRWRLPDGGATDLFPRLLAANLLAGAPPDTVGIRFVAAREEALRAAAQSQDFGGLFIGFSFFLILAALILVSLLFRFGLEQRAAEIGTLLAAGFTPRQVRRLFLLEGTALALSGSAAGALGAIAYARLMLHGLTTLWRSATNTSTLHFYMSANTVLAGVAAAAIVAAATLWLVLRRQGRQPARALLAGELDVRPAGRPSRRFRGLTSAAGALFRASTIGPVALILALATIAATVARHETSNPEYFFSAGALCLVAALAFSSWCLRRLVGGASASHLSAGALAVRGAARRRSRSVATVALLACGVFLIAAIGVFRLDATHDAAKRSSGTGGFALIGESTLPVVKDLNTRAGREALGLDEKLMQGVSFVPLRVQEGDEASCLNLNRAQSPRLLGVNPQTMPADAFSVAALMPAATTKTSPWALLSRAGFPDRVAFPEKETAALGDAASIQWAMGKKIGDALPYRDENGREFDLRLIGGLANSILQGSLIIDEAEFEKRFPRVPGYRMFLIDCPSNAVPQVSAELSRALEDYGFQATPAAERLAAFNAVQNTYLNTFQILGGLGLLLGSAGLGIVVLRNVFERRGELALLIAVGLRRGRVQQLVLIEHAALLGLGLFAGVVSAVVAVLPALLSPRGELPLLSLGLTLAAVVAFGLLSTLVATRVAVSGNLLEGLRNE